MKPFLLLIIMLLLQQLAMANNDLPIDTLGSTDTSKPLVFYISGDGGFNSFSKSFIQQWHSLGYAVIALNAKSYFFNSQPPDVAAKDINALLIQYLVLWKRNNIILVGYSFGADVLPFIQTRLSAVILSKIKQTVLLSPSQTTDFAVHLFYSNSGSSVPAEINKLTKPVLVIFGEDEKDAPDKNINNPKAFILKVKGDHHYSNNVENLLSEINKRM